MRHEIVFREDPEAVCCCGYVMRFGRPEDLLLDDDEYNETLAQAFGQHLARLPPEARR